eukprot:scaffold10972_cov127-Isochrysis_galbana.AAC.2
MIARDADGDRVTGAAGLEGGAVRTLRRIYKGGDTRVVRNAHPGRNAEKREDTLMATATGPPRPPPNNYKTADSAPATASGGAARREARARAGKVRNTIARGHAAASKVYHGP